MSTHSRSGTNAKRIAPDFYDLAFVKRNTAQAAASHLSERYTQHNLAGPDGV